MRLEGKVAIVTGGGSGIGRGIALAMAQEGARISIPDIQADNAEKVVGEVKGLARYITGQALNVDGGCVMW
jgi:NAD(P)-dependent dehydrogenase (short-subunit alcohol dehydrogenase family)